MPPPEYSTASLLQGALDLSQSRCAIFAVAVGGLVVYCIGLLFYRLWLHPLAKIPGPKLLGVTGLPYLYQEHVQGTWVRRIAELHHQYGPIVRISPNGLALDGSIAWPEVYAHRKGKTEFLKKKNYFFPGDEGSLIQSSTEVHRRQRRQLAHAFSDAALYEQEPITNQYISLLIQQLSLRAEKGEPIDATKWMNFTTFDIIGDLTYADSFHCLDSNDYHPWVLSLFQGIRGVALGRFIDALPLIKPLITLAISTDGIKKEVDNRELAVTKARSRMAQGESPSGRRDFMTYMMRSGRDGGKGMLDHEILLNSPLLVTAGSETTATAVSGFLYYLANNPEVYRALVAEIRDAFKSESEISMKTTAPLQYLHACIEETLRVYPPVAETPPRVSPGDIIAGYWVPEGTLVCTYQWATFRNPENFVDPDSFSPERWLPSAHPRYNRKFERDNHSVFKPFSHGPRDCIGKNLAYSEMRVIIARFLYKFDYVLDGDHDDWHTCQNIYLIWEKGPLMLKLMPRKMEVEENHVETGFRLFYSFLPFKLPRNQPAVASVCRSRLIITSSISAHIANVPVDQPVYNASKAFVAHFGKSVAREWRDFARVNIVSPGFFDTKMGAGPQAINEAYRMAALGRQGHVKEIKGLYLYLASDASTYTTGSEILIDGGYVLS